MHLRLLFAFFLPSFVCSAQQAPYQSFEVDTAAEPHGGHIYLTSFLQVNLRKPILAEAKGIGGRVVLGGVVEPDGRISDVKVIQSLRLDCDREAVRVFSRFNAWKPAYKGGKAVRQQVSIPVAFKPNPPFLYSNGARIQYFDANSKPLPDSSDQVRFKQIMPLDSNGVPNGDVVVYERKRSDWKEYNRLPLVRKKYERQGPDGQTIYLIGYQTADRLWRDYVYSVDEAGTVLRQTYYENGLATSPELTYFDNGLLAERKESNGQRLAFTSWYPNGQIKQIRSTDTRKVSTTVNPEQVTAYWDSTGRQLVKDGNGRAIYSETVKSAADTTRRTSYTEQGTYVNGLKQGLWQGRYQDGSFFYEEQYDKGVCQGGKAMTAGSDTVRYTVPEQQPEFKGGMQGLGQFLSQNLRYPQEAQRAKVQGRVLIRFVINPDGSVADTQLMSGLGFGTDEEALRVVKATDGYWKPGVHRGRKVRVWYTLPINFSLQ